MPDTNLPNPAPSSTSQTRSKTTGPASSANQTSQSPNPPRSAHFVLQGKGGVGKSHIASLIAQYLIDQDKLSGCFDTDPVNGSFQTIPALGAEPVPLLDKNALNLKGVDRLIEGIVSAKKDVVIDNGAASFLALSSYLVENDIAAFLKQHSITMVVHTVVTGGTNGIDTVKGLDSLIQAFSPAAHIVVWVNEFFGAARFRGTAFEQTAIYLENHAKVGKPVYLRQLDPVMFLPNLIEMLDRKMTFAEAIASDDFMLLEKSRLFRIKDAIWQQLAQVL